MTAKMGIYSAVNSLQWAMPQAKHIQMDSDLLETHTSGFFFLSDHIALIAHCEGNQSLLWAWGV